MLSTRIAFTALLALALAGSAAAQETGNFVVRLGRDTTAVEHFTRSPGRLVIDQAGRSPRVFQRHVEYAFGRGGALSHASLRITAPGAPAGAPPFQLIEVSVEPDSYVTEVRRDTARQVVRAALPPGAVVITGSTPWSTYEGLTMRLAAGRADSLSLPMCYIGGTNAIHVTVQRLGRDSMAIRTTYDLYHAHVDKAGHLLHVTPLGGTQQFTVDRVAALDVPAMAAAFAAREKQGEGLGTLSTRDTVRAGAGGAALWIDYGRPAKRGRTVFGGVVPWGGVWRTGANAATQFRTDKDLVMGGVTVPAGFYTLWTVPGPDGWKLIVNSETGEWGTEHKPEKDLYTIPMSVSALPDPVERFTIGVEPAAQGGVLNLDWDTTRASVAFSVKP
ncbi:MAG TPA: DUF2911 domain-containing protein [Candidatus Eisenbacteria bacterium]|nr:DUF2911 domain-containing protein [Candidatus Eisenbacteria bacterium]